MSPESSLRLARFSTIAIWLIGFVVFLRTDPIIGFGIMVVAMAIFLVAEWSVRCPNCGKSLFLPDGAEMSRNWALQWRFFPERNCTRCGYNTRRQ